ncbi:collagen, type I, alpha 1a-like [Cavia porcellus]|uniref:collagen, type I, alpha 1a-like n=1 Tax=Cavia porcellus TaxID=10141 RepID=UPI002FE36859
MPGPRLVTQPRGLPAPRTRDPDPNPNPGEAPQWTAGRKDGGAGRREGGPRAPGHPAAAQPLRDRDRTGPGGTAAGRAGRARRAGVRGPVWTGRDPAEPAVGRIGSAGSAGPGWGTARTRDRVAPLRLLVRGPRLGPVRCGPKSGVLRAVGSRSPPCLARAQGPTGLSAVSEGQNRELWGSSGRQWPEMGGLGGFSCPAAEGRSQAFNYLPLSVEWKIIPGMSGDCVRELKFLMASWHGQSLGQDLSEARAVVPSPGRVEGSPDPAACGSGPRRQSPPRRAAFPKVPFQPSEPARLCSCPLGSGWTRTRSRSLHKRRASIGDRAATPTGPRSTARIAGSHRSCFSSAGRPRQPREGCTASTGFCCDVRPPSPPPTAARAEVLMKW